MNDLQVNLGSRSYPVYFDSDHFEKIPELIAGNFDSKVFIISDTNVEKLYRTSVTAILKKFRCEHDWIIVPAGERYKGLITTADVVGELLKKGAHRQSSLIALGGGMVGDLAGFVAATYMRGISYAHIPTTLLAMVDSSVGGKVAVNHPLAKNVIGAFYQPKFVFGDSRFLDTLSKREMVCGLAEIIKYGLIAELSFFEWLETNWEKILTNDVKSVRQAVYTSCLIKTRIVEKDEFESGPRMILNFGHTVGHALENLSGYETIKHGEAVLYGMIAASYYSMKMNFLKQEDYIRIERIVTAIIKNHEEKAVADFIKKTSWKDILGKMLSDKKSTGSMKLIVLKGIGRAEVHAVTDQSKVADAFEHLKVLS